MVYPSRADESFGRSCYGRSTNRNRVDRGRSREVSVGRDSRWFFKKNERWTFSISWNNLSMMNPERIHQAESDT
jgi:hypothetical protein